jgi:hypothetical protein
LRFVWRATAFGLSPAKFLRLSEGKWRDF